MTPFITVQDDLGEVTTFTYKRQSTVKPMLAWMRANCKYHTPIAASGISIPKPKTLIHAR